MADSWTPERVRDEAALYNADGWTPEDGDLASDLANGQAVISVYSDTDRSGRNIRVVATAGVTAPDGGFIAAEDPRVLAAYQRLPAWAGKIGGGEKFARLLAGRAYGTALPMEIKFVAF